METAQAGGQTKGAQILRAFFIPAALMRGAGASDRTL